MPRLRGVWRRSSSDSLRSLRAFDRSPSDDLIEPNLNRTSQQPILDQRRATRAEPVERRGDGPAGRAVGGTVACLMHQRTTLPSCAHRRGPAGAAIAPAADPRSTARPDPPTRARTRRADLAAGYRGRTGRQHHARPGRGEPDGRRGPGHGDATSWDRRVSRLDPGHRGAVRDPADDRARRRRSSRPSRATPDEIARVQELADRLESGPAGGGRRRRRPRDVPPGDRHRRRAARRRRPRRPQPAAQHAVRGLRTHVLIARAVFPRLYRGQPHRRGEHRRMVEAIAAHDGAAARDAMAAHLRQALADTQRHLEATEGAVPGQT